MSRVSVAWKIKRKQILKAYFNQQGALLLPSYLAMSLCRCLACWQLCNMHCQVIFFCVLYWFLLCFLSRSVSSTIIKPAMLMMHFHAIPWRSSVNNATTVKQWINQYSVIMVCGARLNEKRQKDLELLDNHRLFNCQSDPWWNSFLRKVH